MTDEALQAHIDLRKGSRCVEYMDRLFAYQEQTGRSISPAERGIDALIYE